MPFNADGYRTAAKAAGVDDATINGIIASYANKAPSVDSQMKTTQLNQANLNYKQDLATATPDPNYYSGLADKGLLSREEAIKHGVIASKVAGLQSQGDINDERTRKAATYKQAQADYKTFQAAQGTFHGVIDEYKNLKLKGPLLGYSEKIPFTSEATYEQSLGGLAPILGKIFGGQGSGLRITQAEINNWIKLLPRPTDTASQVSIKTGRLDKLLKDRFGEGLGKDYLPKAQKTSVSSSPGTSLPQMGSVQMISPDGSKYSVPAGKVNEARQHGWK